MHTIDTDVVIFGGGIAGLWTLNVLRQAGFEAILLESTALGEGQTLRSQGIIHGGMKYALSGLLSPDAEAIADMPALWRQCLNGQGPVDLRKVKVLSEHHYMWSESSLAARLTTFFGSKMLRGRIEAVTGEARPSLLQSPSFKGTVYRLNDMVLDVPSLITTLANQHLDHIYQISSPNCLIEVDDHHHTRAIVLTRHQKEPLKILPKWLVLAAGKGNQELMLHLGLQSPAMQIRPLHMVLMKQKGLPPFYAHCIGTSSKPRLTITSHPCSDGDLLWYFGGELAEQGVERDTQMQIEEAQRELRHLFPWVDHSGARWKTLRIDRAEPEQEQFMKPDHAFARLCGNAVVAWPTKLALAPNLAQQILALLQAQGAKPVAAPLTKRLDLPLPPFGPTLEQLMRNL